MVGGGAGDGKVKECCPRKNIPVLFTIPQEIACLYSQGVALVDGVPHYKKSS